MSPRRCRFTLTTLVSMCASVGALAFASTPAMAKTGHVFSSSFTGSGANALSEPSGVALNNETGVAPPALGAINFAKSRKASVIGVTDSPVSPLRSGVDILLPASVSGIGTQNSLVAAMAIANVLVNGVTSASPKALERYSETIRLLEEWDAYLLETHIEDA